MIQGAGVLPLDVRAANLDFCAAGSYKWMLGAFGVALFYVRESLLDMMTLDRFGYFHVERKRGALDHQLRRDGRKFMYATPAFGPIFELTAGLRYLEAIGIEKISQHCIGLAHYLFDQLSELEVNLLTPPGNPSHIVAFAHGLAPQQVKAHLAGRKIHVNFRDEDRHIRIGAALFNNRQEIDAFVAAMSELYQRA